MEINQHNSIGSKHGYWNSSYEIHLYNGKPIGYTHFKNIPCKCHFIYGYEIGCEQYKNSQFYYNKPDKKFREQIKWKE